jgi:fatty acid desaturase
MPTEPSKPRIEWYRSPIPREVLAELNQRSDALGFAQTLGYFAVVALLGGSAWYAVGRAPWWAVLILLYLHGAVFAFLLNAFHEFVHQSVFKTKWLNTFFTWVTSFLSWNNPVMFWASHMEHHKYTLHPPDDLEVVLPAKVETASFFKFALVNPWDFWFRFKIVWRLAVRGKVEGRWEELLFPPGSEAKRRDLITWARIILFGHAGIIVVAGLTGWWMLPVVVTFAPFYGGLLQWLCNNTQHFGLQDKVPDFRLCTRSVRLHPVLQFLYWHMNYHIEHHMYAAVPCYKLGKLHRAIRHDLPEPPGLLGAWRQMLAIQKIQKTDPAYQYIVPLPTRQAASA